MGYSCLRCDHFKILDVDTDAGLATCLCEKTGKKKDVDCINNFGSRCESFTDEIYKEYIDRPSPATFMLALPVAPNGQFMSAYLKERKANDSQNDI